MLESKGPKSGALSESLSFPSGDPASTAMDRACDTGLMSAASAADGAAAS